MLIHETGNSHEWRTTGGQLSARRTPLPSINTMRLMKEKYTLGAIAKLDESWCVLHPTETTSFLDRDDGL